MIILNENGKNKDTLWSVQYYLDAQSEQIFETSVILGLPYIVDMTVASIEGDVYALCSKYIISVLGHNNFFITDVKFVRNM